MTTASDKPSKRKTTTDKAKAAKTTKAPAKRTTKSNKTRKTTSPEVTPEQRHQLIAEAAYLRAEARGFGGEDPISDWLAAEQEIDGRLAEQAQGSSKVIH